jgi:hypothetical protein
VDFEILLHDSYTKQKQHKISSWGLGSWDPAAKEHMMTYGKQTIKRLYNDVRRGSKPLEGYEEVLPHVNSYEFSHIFWHQTIKEQLKV